MTVRKVKTINLLRVSTLAENVKFNFFLNLVANLRNTLVIMMISQCLTFRAG